ncbi:MAG: hypothetical protein ABI422_02485 [Sphingomicrobium sp.]
MRRLILLLALAGCAPAAPTAGSGDAFARELAGRVAGPVKTCIPSNSSANLRVIDSRTLAYESGRTLWVNRLDSSCPGIAPLSTLIVDAGVGEYCRGDRVRGLQPGEIIPGPPCALQNWTRYRRP